MKRWEELKSDKIDLGCLLSFEEVDPVSLLAVVLYRECAENDSFDKVGCRESSKCSCRAPPHPSLPPTSLHQPHTGRAAELHFPFLVGVFLILCVFASFSLSSTETERFVTVWKSPTHSFFALLPLDAGFCFLSLVQSIS